jgi:hypothetical protein
VPVGDSVGIAAADETTGRHREQPHRPTATKPSTTTAGGTASRARPAAPATRPAEIVGAASGGGGRAEVTGPVSNMPTYRAQPWGSRMRKGF